MNTFLCGSNRILMWISCFVIIASSLILFDKGDKDFFAVYHYDSIIIWSSMEMLLLCLTVIYWWLSIDSSIPCIETYVLCKGVVRGLIDIVVVLLHIYKLDAYAGARRFYPELRQYASRVPNPCGLTVVYKFSRYRLYWVESTISQQLKKN